MKRLALPCALLAAACASDRWLEYDLSSHSVVMEPGEQVFAEHIALLEAWAADPEHPMPPGLYAELAYWLAKVGRYPEAEAALQKELAAYPQSRPFVDALRALTIPATSAAQPAGDAKDPAESEVKP